MSLFHPTLDDLPAGACCHVEYRIDVERLTGTCYLILDSQHPSQFSQLYTQERTVPLNEAGVVSGSYYTRASAVPDGEKENAVLMRAYLYVRSNSSLQCKIRIAVHELEPEEVTGIVVDDICPIGENLYSTRQLLLKEEYSTANADGSFSIALDNTQGDQDRYANFSHKYLASAIPGETYKVEYRIDTSQVSGNCYVVFDSQHETQRSQLYHGDQSVCIHETGTVSGAFVATANDDQPEEGVALLLLRSYVYAPAGSGIRCTIQVRVFRIGVYTVEWDAGQPFAMLGEAVDEDGHAEGELLQYEVPEDGGRLYSVRVRDAENNALSYTLDEDILSFELPASDVTVSVREYPLSWVGDGGEVRVQRIGRTYWLLLPACADYSALTLSGRLTLAGEKAEARVQLQDDAPVDVTALFDRDMLPGEIYELRAFDGDACIDTVRLMKADCLKTLFIQSDLSLKTINESKENSGKGTLSLVDARGQVLLDSAAMNRFRGRGNTSWFNSDSKKSYSVKLDKKAELIEDAGKAKSWCLITDNCGGENVNWVHEAPGLANLTAYELYRQIGGAYAIDCEMVNLYFNGLYHGTYLLTEKVEIRKNRVDIAETEYDAEDKTGRVQVRASQDTDADKPKRWGELSPEYITDDDDPAIRAGIQAYQYAPGSRLSGTGGGFLLEMDRNFVKEACWFVTRRGYPYTVKDPEYATREQVQRIAVYIQEFEDAIYAESGYNGQGVYYTRYLDLNAASAKLLIEFITTQVDAFITSCFMAIDTDANGLHRFAPIRLGPAWDYDGTNLTTSFSNSAFMGKTSDPGIANQKEIVNKLFSRGEVARAVTEMSDTVLREAFDAQTPLATDGNGGRMDENIRMLYNSQRMNMLLHPNTEDDLNPTDDFEGFKQQFINRYLSWYTMIFADTSLEGLVLENRGDCIEAVVTGTADAIAWYEVDPSTGVLMPIEGAEGSVYRPAADGIYCAKATGSGIYDSHVDIMYASIVYEGQ